MPSHSVRSPNLLVCCCWTSQNPHPSSSRSASLSAGGWHQALASGASHSTNTFAFGLNPYHELHHQAKKNCDYNVQSTQTAKLFFLIWVLLQQLCCTSTILHLRAFVLLLAISTLHVLYSLLSTSSPIVYTNDVIQPVIHCVVRTEAEQHDKDLRRSIL